MPSSVESIGKRAFLSYRTTQIAVAEGNRHYDSRGNCNAIIETKSNILIRGCVNTIIPDDIVEIAEIAFSNCNLTNITLPEGLKRIGKEAFDRNELSYIDIPGSVEDIGGVAFRGCSLKEVVLHNGLTSIGDWAFRGCYNLKTITIPESVNYIGEYAFEGCGRLAGVIAQRANPTAINADAFGDDTYLLSSLYVPVGSKEKYSKKRGWSSFNTIVEGNPQEPTEENNKNIVVPLNFDRNYVPKNEESTILISMENKGTNPVNNISYIISGENINCQEHTFTFSEPWAQGEDEREIPIIVDGIEKTGVRKAILSITKVNGAEVNYGFDYRSKSLGELGVFSNVTSHKKIYVEEFTSTTCPWAFRAKVGIERLEEVYGDQIVHVVTHVSDPMYCEPKSFSPVTPRCDINGYFGLDPYYGSSISTPFGIMDDFEKAMKDPVPVNIKILEASWANQEQTAIKVITESTCGLDIEGHPFDINFELIEDGMKGDGTDWEQYNNYAFMSVDDPNLKPLTKLPSKVSDMEYNHVNVMNYEWYDKSSIPISNPLENTPHQDTIIIDISSGYNIIQDKNKLSVVAYVESAIKPYYVPFIVDKMPIAEYTNSGISSMKYKNTNMDVYDIRGHLVRKATDSLEGLTHGIYIVGGKKVIK